MGTTVHVEVWHPNAQIRQQGINKALEIMDHVNRLMSLTLKKANCQKSISLHMKGLFLSALNCLR